MKRSLLISAWLAGALFGQGGELKFWTNGVGVALHTESNKANSPLSTAGAITTDKEVAHRVVLDRADTPLFAYDLDLRKAGDALVGVRIKPVNQKQLRASDFLRGKIARDVPTVAAERDFPPLRPGDEIRIDIMYNPQTGEKLTDVIRPVVELRAGTRVRAFPGPQFSFERVRVAIDDKTVAEERGSWMVGEAILMRVPGHGAYYMAVRPAAGFPFQPSGRIDHNVLRFRADGEDVEITGRSNLLMKSETGTVWIYHVPEAPVKSGSNTVEFNCSGDLEQLMTGKDD